MAYSHPMAGPSVPMAADFEARPAAVWEKALALAGFLILLGTFRSILLSGAERTDGSRLFQLISSAIYLSGIVILARGIPAWALIVLRRSWPLVILTALPLLSVMWSQAPGASLRRAIALLLCSAFAFYLVARFDARTIINILTAAFAIFLIVGILAAALPGVGITPGGSYAGAWRGMTGHKNVFARSLALAVALLPIAALVGLVSWRRAALAVALVALALLILAKSATSLVAALAGIVFGTTLYVALGGRLHGARLRPEIGVTFLILAAIATAMIVTFGWIAILETLGRDATLTGRTKLWDWAIAIGNDRAWLGSGFRAFWITTNTKYFFEFFAWHTDPDGTPSDTFAGPEHAHSGYVDTYLELGLVGIAALALTILSAMIVLWRAFHTGNPRVGFIFAVILSFLLIYATTERSILQHSEDLWFLFTLFYLLTVKGTILNRPMAN
jgi:exopolysaccharide production protein ExoQ